MDGNPSMEEHIIDVSESAKLTDNCRDSDRVINGVWERVEKKAKLMGSEDTTVVTMLSISEVQLENFDITQFTKVDMTSLKQAGLASFVKLLSEIPSIAMTNVDTFFRTYHDNKREGFIQREGK